MKITLKYFDVLSLLIAVLCMDVAYINLVVSSLPNLLFYGRMGMIVVLLFLCIKDQQKMTKGIVLLTAFVVLEYIMTKVNGLDQVQVFRVLSAPYLIALYLELFYQKRVRILRMWNVFLTTLALINLLTILLFPSGLYQGALYSDIWFLGYKTQMYVYLLPWCLISAYLEVVKKGKMSYLSYTSILLSAGSLWLANSTAAMVSILLVGAMYLLFMHQKRILGERAERFFYNFFRPKIVISTVLIVTGMVMMIQKIPFVAYFVETFLNKDATLTTRTGIWSRLIEKVMQKPLFGYGLLKAEQYTVYAKNSYATNAHNTLLSILITVGIVGLILYLWMVFVCMERKNKTYQLQELVFVAGIVSFLIVGITSSTFVFCPYAFFCYSMLAVEKKDRNDVKPKKKRKLHVRLGDIQGKQTGDR